MTDPAEPATDRLFARLTWAAVALGVLVRVVRFVLPFPLWGDEVFVCQNFLDRDFVTILHQLENGQICPPLFLWAQLAVFRALGGGEMAMRLLPVLAGLVALVWFARLTRRLVPPFPAFLAVGFLSLAYWPVSLSTCAKPYSFDLLAAVAVTAAALHWHERMTSIGRGALFAVALPLALLGSYTAAFAAGGAAVALLPAVWRTGWAARGLFAVACVLVLAAFAFDLRVGTAQADSAAGPGTGFIYDYWRFAFPPPRAADFPLWLLSLLTGRMFAYPVGDANGGSTLTFLMCLVGVWRWWRSHPRWQLVLLVAPVGLSLLAAVIGKYPFGGCGRLTQYAAPAICLLAGVGSATTLGWVFRTPAALRRLGYFYAVVFLALAVGHVVIDVRRPYHDPEAKWTRDDINGFARELGPADRVVLRPPRDTDVTIPRYHFRLMGERVTWGCQWPTGATGDVWVVDVWMAAPDAPHTPPPLTVPPGWTPRETRRREHLWPADQKLALTLVYERYARDP